MRVIPITINARDEFLLAIEKVFGDACTFLDILENNQYDDLRYDCFIDPNDETYIIDRETGSYINWYKFYHLGRDIHSTVKPDEFEEFLTCFKKCMEDRKND